LCIETSKELRTRLAEVVYVEYADQSLTKQLVTCSMDTAYPPIRNRLQQSTAFDERIEASLLCPVEFISLVPQAGKVGGEYAKVPQSASQQAALIEPPA
jgi:hypothetical protein